MKMILMKKIALFLLGILAFYNSSFAQTTTPSSRLSLSQEMKEPANSTINDYLGEDEDHFYVLRKKIKSAGTSMFGHDFS